MLAEQYGIDLTLNFFLPRRFTRGAPTNWAPVSRHLSIDQYELMNAARFLYGPDLRQGTPVLSGDRIPIWEGIRLLLNRMAELIEAILLWEPEKEKGLMKPCNKLLTGCGDTLLLIVKRYHYSYRERMERFRELSACPNPLCSQLSLAERSAISGSYADKLYPHHTDVGSMKDFLSKALTASEKAFRLAIRKDMAIQYSTYDEFRAQYLQHPRLKQYCKGHPMVQNLVSVVRDGADARLFSLRDFARSVPIIHKVYAELPLWLYGSFKPLWDRHAFDSLKCASTRSTGWRLVSDWHSFCG
jgi:hypothetical protein